MEPAPPESAPPAATEHYLLLALGGLLLALPRAAVRELLPLPHLARPPGLPPVVAGFLDLGAAPLPVLRTARLLGLEAQTPEHGPDALYQHVVVLAEGGLGLLVDRALDLLSLPPGARQPVEPGRTLHGCVAATLPAPRGIAHLLDPARLLLAQERAALAELTAAATTRAEGWAP